MPYHSGFGPSDLPIWTNLMGENFRRHVFFFVYSYREEEKCSGSENTLKNYRMGTSCLSVFKYLQK